MSLLGTRTGARGTPLRAARLAAVASAAAAVLLLASAGTARSQRVIDDRGGVLYLTLAPELKYDPYTKYCGLSGLPSPAQAVTTGDVGEKPQVAFLLASWPDSARPELGAVSFGIRYPRGIEVLRWGTCVSRALNAPTNNWPMSGEGIAIAYAAGLSDTSRTQELAWMVIVAHKSGKVELSPHPDPTFGAHFATPGYEAPIAELGSLGFGEPGSAPPPAYPGPVLGAACVRDSVCTHLTRKETEFYGESVWLGENVPCTSVLCGKEAPRGACCLPDGTCKMITRKECMAAGGRYQGDGMRCSPEPCAAPTGAEGEGKGR